jgi:hypothetical protein
MFWNFISSLPVKRGGSLSFLTIFTSAVPELLDLIWRKIGFLPYVVSTHKTLFLISRRNILRNTTQIIIRHRVKILFSVISSPITLERQRWKSSKMKGILLSSPVSCWLLWAQLTKIYPPLPTSVQPISITITLLIVLTKNERDPPLFTGKLLIKFQNILRNTTQVWREEDPFRFWWFSLLPYPELLDLIWRKIGFLP